MKFCLAHTEDLGSHSNIKNCTNTNVNEKYLMKLAIHHQNALGKFESQGISLSKEIINEVNNCLIDNFNYIQQQKKAK